MIPNKIHYCWFGRNPLPNNVKKCIASWEKYNSDYEIIQWNEDNFDVTCHPFVKSAYESKAWAFVSDYTRLKVVYENGGIYLDTDVEILRKIDSLLRNECYIGVQQRGRLCTTGLGFGAVKFNPVVRKMLDKYDGLVFEENRKTELACPKLNAKVFAELGHEYSEDVEELDGVTVYPPRYFDPLSPGTGSENLLCEDTYSIHHYSASWMGKGIRLKRRLIRIIGQDKVMKMKKTMGISN